MMARRSQDVSGNEISVNSKFGLTAWAYTYGIRLKKADSSNL